MKGIKFNQYILNSYLVFIISICSFFYVIMHLPITVDALSIMESSAIKDFEYSPDGNRFAIAATDEIWLFDAHTYEKKLTIKDDTHPYGGWYDMVEFSHDGNILASVNNRNDEIQLWNPINGEEILSIFEPTDVTYSILFSPDSKKIASEGSDDMIRVWDVQTGHLLKSIKVSASNLTAFSPDGNTIALTGIQRIALWDINTGNLKHTLEGHTDEVYDAEFSPDGKVLASAGFQEIILWNPNTGKRLNSLTGHRGSVESLAFSPDGNILAGGSYQEILLWDVSKAQHIKTLSKPYIFVAGVTTLDFSPDGNMLASMSDTHWNSIRIWDVKTGKHKRTISDDRIRNSAPIKFSPDVSTVTYIVEDSFAGWQYVIVFLQPPLNKILSGNTNIGKIPRKGTKLSEVHETPVYYQSPVKSTFFAKDGKTFVSISNNDIALWNADSGKHRVTIKDEFAQIYSVALSPDAKTIATGNGWNNSQIRLWNTRNGKLKTTLNGHTSWIDDLAFSPDGKTLFSASRDSTIRLWDTKTGEHKVTLKEHTAGVHTMELSSNGKLLASACHDNKILLWDISSVQNAQPIATYEGHTGKINLIRFTENGNKLASASSDDTIWLYNLDTKQSATLEGHTSWIHYLEFTKNGKTLVSGSLDKTIRLWETDTGTLRSILEKNGYSHSQIIMSPDGNTLISKGDPVLLHVWDLNTGKLKATIEAVGGPIDAYEFLPSGESLISTDIDTRWFHKWNVETGELQMKIKTRPD